MSDQKLIIGYYRLSMEDDSEGESNSIINQRKLVKDYISHIPELAAFYIQNCLPGFPVTDILSFLSTFYMHGSVRPSQT